MSYIYPGEERGAFYDRIAVRAPLDLRPRLNEAAQVAGITAAELVRTAIEARVTSIMNQRGAARHDEVRA